MTEQKYKNSKFLVSSVKVMVSMALIVGGLVTFIGLVLWLIGEEDYYKTLLVGLLFIVLAVFV